MWEVESPGRRVVASASLSLALPPVTYQCIVDVVADTLSRVAKNDVQLS